MNMKCGRDLLEASRAVAEGAAYKISLELTIITSLTSSLIVLYIIHSQVHKRTNYVSDCSLYKPDILCVVETCMA